MNSPIFPNGVGPVQGCTGQGRLANIDGLRGLAALLVLLQHLCERYSQHAPLSDSASKSLATVLLTYCDLGKVGVVTFFAISGFVVPFSFHEPTPRIGFIASRVFRLYPAYWISLLAAFLILPVIHQERFSYGQLFANATLLQTAIHQKDVLSVYWTLFIEVIFYACCFMLFQLGVLLSSNALFVSFSGCLAWAIGAGVLRARGHSGPPTALPLYLAVMWFGTSVRLATRENDQRAAGYCRAMLAMLVIAVPLVWSIAYDRGSHKESVVSDIAGFYVALAMFLLAAIRGVFATRLLAWAGAISYGLYLFHPIALDVGDFASSTLSWPFRGAVLIVVSLMLSFATAGLVYARVERPMIRIGRVAIAWLARPIVLRDRAA